MVVAGVSSRPNPRRPPLLPSEAVNANRRPKYSEVTSRYMSPASSISTSMTATSSSYSSSSSSNSSSSRRSPSPLISRTAPMAAIRRSHSVERKRPATAAANPRPSTPGRTGPGEVSAAVKLLVASSRNMSVSLQGTSFSHPGSKSKPAQTMDALTSSRKGTPERRKATPAKDQVENSRPNAQHRWPGRSGDVNFLTRSLNCGDDTHKLAGSRSVVRQLQQSMNEESSGSSLADRLNDHSINEELDTANSDPGSAQSLSSGSFGSVKDVAQVRGGRRGIVVPARFWQETTNRIGRKPEPGSPMSKNNVLKSADSSTFNSLKKSSSDGSNSNSNSSPRGVLNKRGLSSPLRGSAVRPASPSKFMTHSASPSRGMPSPARVRNAGPINLNSNASPALFVLSYAADVRDGKAGDNRVFNILKLLHTRHLQLRFINARADASMLVQKENAEKSMYNAWVATLKLRHSVKSKRVELQRLRQSLKLYSILKRQMLHLDVWNRIDRDHGSSLLGASEALEASTLQLPLVSGARGDIQDVKDAICSAVEVMQTMVSSIGVWLTKVDHVSSLASAIANTSAKENELLYQCQDLMSTLTALQVKDCSIKTHMLQVRRVPSNLKTQV